MNEYKFNLEHFNFKKEDIKHELLSMTEDVVVSRTTYPNGLIMVFEVSSEQIHVQSNWDIKQESDGTFTPIAP